MTMTKVCEGERDVDTQGGPLGVQQWLFMMGTW